MGNGEPISKLAEYEDLEEQGLLLKAPPCRPGDTAYIIDTDNNLKAKIFTGTWDIVSFRVFNDGEIEVHGQITYEIPDMFYGGKKMMPHCIYVGQSGTKVGEKVFLTYKEAEQALAKLKK
jgi:hypothetical protein